MSKSDMSGQAVLAVAWMPKSDMSEPSGIALAETLKKTYLDYLPASVIINVK